MASDVALVKQMMKSGERVILFDCPVVLWMLLIFEDVHQFAGAMKALGFYGVSETAEGAAYVTAEYHRIMQENSMKNIIFDLLPVRQPFD